MEPLFLAAELDSMVAENLDASKPIQIPEL